LLVVLLGNISYSQSIDTVPNKNNVVSNSSYKDMKKQYIIEQTIENIAENSEDENIDYTTLFDQLNYYYEHPINLNRKEIKFDLEQLMLLDQFQIKSLISHKEKYGKFLNIYELQTLNSFSSSDIRKILPFIVVNENFDATHLSFLEMLNKGKNDIFLGTLELLTQPLDRPNLAIVLGLVRQIVKPLDQQIIYICVTGLNTKIT